MTNGHLEYLNVRMRAVNPQVPATIKNAEAAIAEMRERGYRVACNEANMRLRRIIREHAIQEKAKKISADLKTALAADDIDAMQRICRTMVSFFDAPLWLMEEWREAEERLWDRDHPADTEFPHPSVDDIVRAVDLGYL